MSRASKATLAVTGLGTAGIIYFVHWAQENDRAAMHRGVERDMANTAEKQRIRLERQAEFEMQKALEQEYLKLQTVHSTTDDPNTTGKPSSPGS
ncbi:hypothetical protein N7541_010975 [Penicillium brevicompactum]|uniref:Cytochrome c oxidase assembly protein n=1 Tax=Penicillium brevicompactum TaxID=5074 RepID=A0A9W9QJ93_PENBR|nr:uncharacterized protein N7506_009289 [Penicillium brevicompactum]KAJ5326187.1 hypothetical protein N7506_009289 [Penicillium brevicompactum]KAJ5339000.1 hypothetical protein N7452_005728 [Penicillium brevicompactum]KAJ5341851.1 hypothetical protein N7541_010975 [Penicillium brevicompactum]